MSSISALIMKPLVRFLWDSILSNQTSNEISLIIRHLLALWKSFKCIFPFLVEDDKRKENLKMKFHPLPYEI